MFGGAIASVKETSALGDKGTRMIETTHGYARLRPPCSRVEL